MDLILIKQPFLIIMIGLLLLALAIIFYPLLKEKHLRRLSLVFILAFSTLSLSLYFYWGASADLVQSQALNQIEKKLLLLTQDQKLNAEKIYQGLETLEKEIAYSHAGLARLGEIYITLGAFDKSQQVYQQATKLAPHHLDYEVQWIYTHSLMNKGKLPIPVQKKAMALVAKHPEQKVLVNLLAIDHYFQGQHQQAIDAWQSILESDQNLTPERRLVLERAIVSAQKALTQIGMPKEQDINLQVKVSLSPKLQSQVSPHHAVFVFVKCPNQRAPLAVIRKKVHELPFMVNIGKEQQMLANQGLSLGQEVIIVAKISKSGDPLNKEGDLQGISQKIMLHSDLNPILLEINEQSFEI